MNTSSMLHSSLIEPGRFLVGCNYWASHAGTAMWADWMGEVVAADLKQLSEAGLQVLRVFLMWPDFQPIEMLYAGEGSLAEVRHGEQPLPSDEIGQAGLSAQALEHFGQLADLAEQNGLKLIVSLVTGWMSGRLFVPPALRGRNVLTDPLAIQWQMRLVREFVRRFRHHPAILAWDLGNECNVMAAVPSSQAAWLWTAALASTIRSEDPSRPIVSGMHSLESAQNALWRIQDQGELTDVLTTHPYPYFTPYCDQDPLNTLRPCLHATAQSRWYADVGGRPCMAEELGTLGPMFASESIAAAFARTVLFSLWAHDCHALLWWCAYDQGHLEHAPYAWHALERELGLLRSDRSPKPVLEAFTEIRQFLDRLPIAALPPRKTEAVCILTEGQDQWKIAYASFILAKQAGFDLVFQHASQPLKEAPLYLVPSMSGGSGFPRQLWLELEHRVRAGATLYLSHHDCLLSPFNAPFGLEVQTRQHRVGDAHLFLDGIPGMPECRVEAPIRLDLVATGSEVLGREPDGNPALTRARYGAGWLYFLTAPIENSSGQAPGAFHGESSQPFWRIYQHIASPLLAKRVVTKDLPQVGVTEHPLAERECVIVLINYSPEAVEPALYLAAGWAPEACWYGRLPERGGEGWRCKIPANDAAVFTVCYPTIK